MLVFLVQDKFDSPSYAITCFFIDKERGNKLDQSAWEHFRGKFIEPLILALSPGAWIHINMLGYYRFCGLESARFVDDWLSKWDWQRDLKVG